MSAGAGPGRPAGRASLPIGPEAPGGSDRPAIRRIADIYAEKHATGRPVISIELFPPKTPRSEESLYQRALPRLAGARPDFMSVTYGAGGSTHDKTLQVVDRIQQTHEITGMAHLTCVSSTRAQIARYLQDAATLGIRNILALRGDPPRDAPDFVTIDNGFDFSYQLIDFVRETGEFSVGAAGFPESRTRGTEGKHLDWQRLKDKVDHGADFVLTQLFFDNADYFEFVEYMVGTLGVTVPITPGILPILDVDQVERFTATCGATIPARLAERLATLRDDPGAARDFGVEFATRQCEDLLAGGAPGLHLYSLNRSPSCLAILRNLGLA